jgi:putative polyketide hydroxylase
MSTETTPVLIAGAGLAGLSTAMFLGLHGVPSIVVERHPGLSAQPKARGQMPATVEALATAGVAERFREAAPPGLDQSILVIAESVTGPVLHDFIHTMPDFSAFSPTTMTGTSQERAERILAARAVELGARIMFSTELESFHQDGENVTAVLRAVDPGSERRQTITARYLVGADGHRGTIRDAAGIGTHGRRSSQPTRTVFVQFEAALDVALRDCAFGLFYLQNPALPGGSATVVTTDHPGRFVLGGALDRTPGPEGEPGSDDPSDLDDRPDATRIIEVIRTACGTPDLEVTILDAAWSSSGDHVTRVADTFQAGRVLLIGDAAHLMPPTGGQGGNAAVMDGYHLAWKLAAVLDGTAGHGLLAGHDAERRPYADALAEQQYANMVQRHAPHLHDETVAPILDPAVGLFGYVCPSGAFVPETGENAPPAALTEGTSLPGKVPALDGIPLFEDPANPSGRPGSRAPHVWLTRAETRLSSRDLFGPRFVLLTGAEGESWAKAAGAAAQALGIPLDVHIVGGASDLSDTEGRFSTAYGITATGGVLVRPDGIIAWRSRSDAAPEDLERALRTVLHR